MQEKMDIRKHAYTILLQRTFVRKLSLTLFGLIPILLIFIDLPTWFINLTLALQLGLSISFMVRAWFFAEMDHAQHFPTRLLFFSLLRLSSSISLLRMMAIRGTSGEYAHGLAAALGSSDPHLSAMMFIFLSIVHIVVLTKGAERVAEVSARFSLDGMPGKQMAIDADLRAGAIDRREAQFLRTAIQKEGHFYAQMDGSMKFVRGEALALIVVTVAAFIATLVRAATTNLSLKQAFTDHLAATTGLGMSLQLPAIGFSVAALIVIQKLHHKGIDLDQKWSPTDHVSSSHRNALLAPFVAGLFMMAMALIPHLPFWPMFLSGLFFLTLTVYEFQKSFLQQILPTFFDTEPAHALSRLRFFYSPALTSKLSRLETCCLNAAEGLFVRWGVKITSPHSMYWERDEKLPSFSFRVEFDGAPLYTRSLAAPQDAEGELDQFFKDVLENQLHEFLGIAETENLLRQFSKTSQGAQDLVFQVLPKRLSIYTLSRLLQRLIFERIPIVNLRGILEAIADATEHQKNLSTEFSVLESTSKSKPIPFEMLCESVRRHQKRLITHELLSEKKTLDVLLVEPILEDLLEGELSASTLSKSATYDLIKSIGIASRQAMNAETLTEPPCLMTRAPLRFKLRSIIQQDLKNIYVTCTEELLDETPIRVVGKVSLET